MKKLVVLNLFLIFFSCTDNKKATGSKPEKLFILASTNIIADSLRSVFGEKYEVASLMEVGVDPHSYIATSKDLIDFRRADWLVFNGLHLEAKLLEVFHSLEKKKNSFLLGESLPRAKLITVEENLFDPHIWFDSDLWIVAIKNFLKHFLSKHPEHAEEINNRFRLWSESIKQTHLWAESKLSSLPQARRVLVTSHDAFSYFARRYGFIVKPVLGISTDAEVGLASLNQVIDFVNSQKLPAIFIESSASPAAIQRVQEASTAKIGGELFGDSLGPPSSSAKDYVGMLRHNTEIIYEALKE